jgi:tetratricopeptide (TPR) repeat protein
MKGSRTRRPVSQKSERTTLLPVLVLLVTGIAVYWNSLDSPFVWDDQTSIVTNPTIQHLWPLSVPLTPPSETPVARRPVVNLSFALNYAYDALHETGYHAGNIAVHIACALVLFGIVRRTLDGPKLRQRFGAVSNTTALGTAMLWMVHPLQSEAVNYITQRTESMMALFFLLTLYCAIRARRSPAAAASWQVVAVVACGLGMASKESMVTAPIIIALYDRTFEFNSWREAWQTRKYFYSALAATWIELGAFVLLQPRTTAGFSAAISPWTYLLNQVEMVTLYLRLSLWPSPLILDYGLPRALSLGSIAGIAIVLLALLVVTAVALVRWPAVGFLAATFFITLAPTSSVIPIVSEVGAERRMYLPATALAVLAAVSVAMLMERMSKRPASQKRNRLICAAAAIAILALLAVRTVYRNAEYGSPVQLWQTVVERRPHGRARAALATELITSGNHDEAMVQLREAVPDYPDARFGLGTELILEGKIEEGVANLRQFIQAQPSNLNRTPARILLAQSLANQGKLQEAVDGFRAVLKDVPTHDGVRANLADVLTVLGQHEQALTEYRALLVRQPNSSVIETRLAMSLAKTGRLNEAIEHFRHARDLDPQSGAINRYLAEMYLRINDGAQGEASAREALRIDPNDGESQNLLGVALAARGRIDEAIPRFQQALRINPNNLQAQANLERALRGGNPRQNAK